MRRKERERQGGSGQEIVRTESILGGQKKHTHISFPDATSKRVRTYYKREHYVSPGVANIIIHLRGGTRVCCKYNEEFMSVHTAIRYIAVNSYILVTLTS